MPKIRGKNKQEWETHVGISLSHTLKGGPMTSLVLHGIRGPTWQMVVEVLVLVAHHTNNYYNKQKHLKRLSTKTPKYCFQLFVRASMPAWLWSAKLTLFSPTWIMSCRAYVSGVSWTVTSSTILCATASASPTMPGLPQPHPHKTPHSIFSEFVFHAHLLVGLHIVDTYILKIFP